MPVTDALNIKDAFVINVGINYDVLVKPNYNSRDVLLACNVVIQDFFDISKWNINQPINISTIFSLLDNVTGVQTVLAGASQPNKASRTPPRSSVGM